MNYGTHNGNHRAIAKSELPLGWRLETKQSISLDFVKKIIAVRLLVSGPKTHMND
jgi:hypothetical protein